MIAALFLSARARRSRLFAWLPILILLGVIGIVWATGWSAYYESPYLARILGLVFTLPAAVAMLYQITHCVLKSGHISLVWFGIGMLFWGCAVPFGGFLMSYDGNAAVTVHNSLIWLAGACHVSGVALGSQPQPMSRWPNVWLIGVYGATLMVILIIVQAALSDELPPFFIAGQGGTPLRQFILISAIGMFALTAIWLLRTAEPERLSAFQYWYALALLLIAIGLLALTLQATLACPLGWISCFAHYFGGVYLLVAAVVGLKERRQWNHPLALALDEAQQRFQALLDMVDDGIIIRELADESYSERILQVNRALSVQLGYNPQEFSKLTVVELTVPEEKEQTINAYRRLRRDGTLRHEKTLIAKDGRRVPVEANTRLYLQRDRLLAVSVIRDMTKHKQTEAMLRANEHFKQVILDSVPAHIAVLNREGRIIAVNQPWRRFASHSKSRKQFPGTGVGTDYLALCRAVRGDLENIALEVHDHLKAILAGREKGFATEYACHSLHRKHWFSITLSPLGEGHEGAVISHFDITAQRQLTEVLREERDRFNHITATVPGAICTFRLAADGQTCFPYASPAFEEIYGVAPQKLTDSAALLWDLLYPEEIESINAKIAESARTLRPWRDEFRLRHPQKGEIWVEGHSMPVREPDGATLWHGYVQNITERKHAEATLRALLAEKEMLLREVQHRVKNNLAAIISLLELQQGTSADSTALSLADAVQRLRAMALVHDLLQNSGQFNRINFSEYLHTLTGRLRDALDPQETIQLDFFCEEVWLPLDTAIPCGLIVNELMTNAYAHAFPEAWWALQTTPARIAITFQQEGDIYRLSIDDNGKGLPAELDWATTSSLGLRLVRMLGQYQLRGRIGLDRTGGTRFWLRYTMMPEAGDEQRRG